MLMLLFPGDLDLITWMGHQIPSEGDKNTNTRFQKGLVNVCFISIKCVWKPEPQVSKINKHEGNFPTVSVWLQFHDIFENHLF